MDRVAPAAARCELTPPTINEPNSQSLSSQAHLPMLRPSSYPRGFDRIPQPTSSINVASSHANTHDSTIVCGQPLRASIEYGRKKLPSRKRPRARIPDEIAAMHAVGLSKDESSIGHHLITPPPSSTPAHCRSAKRRTPTTRKEAVSCKRSLRRRLSDEEKNVIKALPEEMRNFTEREMGWSKEAADADFMLTLPPPKHIYVDVKNRLTFNDSRFCAPVKMRTDAPLVLAGIPSSKPYAPYSPPIPIEPTTLRLPKSSALAFDVIADNSPQEEAFHSRPSIKLIIPDVIKALLVDDWENVTKNTQLVPLPHPKPVTKILEDYSAYEMPKRPANSSHADILEETLSGLKEYFDKSLGRILLYKFERPQYAEVHKKWNSTDPEFQGKTASDIYGAEHLCRLIVSLPELIAQTNMDQQSVNRLREELAKFCTWLSKNATEYFTSSYETPAQDYVEKAKN